MTIPKAIIKQLQGLDSRAPASALEPALGQSRADLRSELRLVETGAVVGKGLPQSENAHFVGQNRRRLSPATMKQLRKIQPLTTPRKRGLLALRRLLPNLSLARTAKSLHCGNVSQRTAIATRKSRLVICTLACICVVGATLPIAYPSLTSTQRNRADSATLPDAIQSQFREIVAAVSTRGGIQSASASQLPGPIVYTPRSARVQQRKIERANLIKFISGMIVVFRPSNEDAGEIAKQIVDISNDNDLDPLFVASLISEESGFRPKAKSSIGALGLMQLRPSTAHEVLRKITATGDKQRINSYLKNPEINIRLGVEYLMYLEERFKGNRALALMAYNWGPANLRKARKKGRLAPKSVRKYAEDILERSRRWRTHFSNAQMAASDAQALAAIEQNTLPSISREIAEHQVSASLKAKS